MMQKIIGNYTGHDLKDVKFLKSNDFVCTSCAMKKLILRPSPLKIHAEPLRFLERIQGDICGSIQPLCGPFRYFMILINASTRWSHVCLLFTCNHAFAKFMTQVIRLKVNFHFEPSMIIVWLKVLRYNILFHMFIHKMVWQNL
jgi:hypothetical protein